MFKKTVNFSELKIDSTILNDLNDGEVIQVIHRGSGIKVMMTQEHYFKICARLEKAEGTSKVTVHSVEKLISDFEKRLDNLV